MRKGRLELRSACFRAPRKRLPVRGPYHGRGEFTAKTAAEEAQSRQQFSNTILKTGVKRSKKSRERTGSLRSSEVLGAGRESPPPASAETCAPATSFRSESLRSWHVWGQNHANQRRGRAGPGMCHRAPGKSVRARREGRLTRCKLCPRQEQPGWNPLGRGSGSGRGYEEKCHPFCTVSGNLVSLPKPVLCNRSPCTMRNKFTRRV